MQALSSKLEGAARTQQMSTTLKNTIPALKSAMKKMDAAGISGSVGEFEKVFEDMDVKTAEMDAAMESMYGGSIDTGEVNNLLGEIQSENAMAMGGQLNNAVGTGQVGQPSAVQQNELNQMSNKLDELKNL